ncbi:MAG: class I SAM-dependent methyltransferase [Parachlamydiaceae bacterium]|nr:class I SAM-dependent methyltransferase [Parachlamydiaceae bacterium]
MQKPSFNSYALVDSGNGRKLERFGPFLLSRPCSQAVWAPTLSQQEWSNADATFLREGDTKWTFHNPKASATWNIEVSNITFQISPTDFGHLGIFPEQRDFWSWAQTKINQAKAQRSTPINVLNLFAYSGGSTLAAARAGAQVCHLDASKGMVDWARENALLNKLEHSPIRWIVDDVRKFLARELRREKRYDAIILDPPSFGRGSKGEIFKIEEALIELLQQCKALLTEKPLFVMLSCHTPGYTPVAMHHLMTQMMHDYKGNISSGEMVLTGDPHVLSLPSGTFARWSHDG